MRTWTLAGLAGMMALLVAGTAAADPAFEVPLDTPSLTPHVDLPAVTIPGTPALTLRVPSVTIPGACDAAACREAATPLPSGSIGTPAREAQPLGAPPVVVPRTCAPENIACLNGAALPAQRLGDTPAVERSEAEIPAMALPAVCAVSPTPCFESFTYSGFALETEDAGPIVLVPDLEITVWIPAIAEAIPVGVPDLGEQGPIPLAIAVPFFGDVGVTLCETPCPAADLEPPKMEVGRAAGGWVRAGSQSYEIRVG